MTPRRPMSTARAYLVMGLVALGLGTVYALVLKSSRAGASSGEESVLRVPADSPETFEITVRDHGDGFDVDDIPDPTNPENLLKANGRGILFMNAFMDEVSWSNHQSGGMVVRMVKKR